MKSSKTTFLYCQIFLAQNLENCLVHITALDQDFIIIIRVANAMYYHFANILHNFYLRTVRRKLIILTVCVCVCL